jgi:hypothetical protein
MEWWRNTLKNKKLVCSILTRTSVDHDIWVDASTSWGIGLLISGRWAMWKLVDELKSTGCDIGWANVRSLMLLVLSQGHAELDQCVVFSMSRSDGYR